MRQHCLSIVSHEQRSTILQQPVTRFAGFARMLGYSLTLALAGLAATPATAQTYSDISAGFDPVHHCTATWVDFDNDGDLDVFLNGQTTGLSHITRLYQNTGSGFTQVTGTGLPTYSSANGITRSSWGDFNNDGYVDVLMIGIDQTGFPTPATELFMNNGGTGTFTAVTVTPSPLLDFASGSVTWGDYDNDGDLDIFATGLQQTLNRVATIFRNDGPNGSGGWNFTDIDPLNFTNPSFNTFHKVMNSEAAWGDFDKDDDLDLFVTGNELIAAYPYTALYRNDGGVFVQTSLTGIPPLARGYNSWGDYDNDGDLDLVAMGESTFPTKEFLVFRNNHPAPSFTQVYSIGGGYSSGSVSWGDGNNDGNLDLLVTGLYAGGTFPLTRLLNGNGLGGFTDDPNAGLHNLYEGQAVWGDYNNDGRLDILLSGREVGNNTSTTKIYKGNNVITANTAPTKPSLLLSTGSTSNSISFRWLSGSDAETNVNALHYNISIMETGTGNVIMPPMANTTTGYRRLPEMGNANLERSWSIGGLQPGTSYDVCVQTIDGGLRASDFRCTTITTTNAHADMMIADCAADVGAEPNGNCGTVYYNSPNVWVRRINDGIQSPQSPLFGQDNFVYVKLKNIGGEILPNGTVHVYFAKANTSANWPINWVNFYNGTSVLHGDYIGQAQILNIFPGDEPVAVIRWPASKIPNPSDFNDPDARHFCILARFVSVSDPMTVIEGTNTGVNTFNNNNIAWVNTSIVKPGEGGGGRVIRVPIEVGAVMNADVNHNLNFTAEGLEGGGDDDNILRYADIMVRLPDVLFERWRETGMDGEGIEVIGDQNLVRIVDAHASIRGLWFDHNEQFPVTAEIVYHKYDPKDTRVFNWHMTQYEEGQDFPTGGEVIRIHMSDREEKLGKTVISRSADLSSSLSLLVRPNPTHDATTISYTLPEDTQVGITLYDVSGKLVRTLMPDAGQKAGTHMIEWNSATADGTPAPNGMYFYRIQMREGYAQGQIIIAR